MTMAPPSMATLIDELPEDFALVGCNGKKIPIDHLTGEVAAHGWPSNPADRDELKTSRHIRAIGVITGQQSGGALVVDFDGPEGETSFQKLTGQPSAALPATIANSSGKPDRKKLFLTVNDFSLHEFITGIGANSKEFPGLEILWNGRQAVIIGDHPETDGYFYLDGCSPAEISKPAEAPDWLISPLIFAECNDAASTLPPSADIETLQVIVSHLIPADFESYWPWLHLGMALKMADPSEDSKNIWLNFCQKLSNYDEKEIHYKWKGFKTADQWAKKFPNKKPLSIATIIKMAMANGYRPKANSTVEKLVADHDYQGLLEKAQEKANTQNLLAFCRCLDIKWNDLKRLVEFDGKTTEPKMAYLILADKFGIEAKKETAKDVFLEVAKQYSYNPVADYFNSLRELDLPLVSNEQLSKGFGFDKNDSQSIELFRLHLRACANRGLNPGCKLDSLCIFEGLQGDCKSGSIKALSPNRSWYDETTHTNFDSKDALSAFNSTFLHEFSEIEKLTMTRDVAEFKSWITREFDNYVEKYETQVTEHPRRCCLFGTTNQKQFLNDPTGSRRFLVCHVVKKSNPKLIEEFRDALWRQSLLELEGGMPYYLETNDQLAIANNERGAIATHTHPWEDLLNEKIGGLPIGTFVSSSSVLAMTEVKPDRANAGHYKILASIMDRLGWIRKKRREDNGPVNGFEKITNITAIVDHQEDLNNIF